MRVFFARSSRRENSLWDIRGMTEYRRRKVACLIILTNFREICWFRSSVNTSAWQFHFVMFIADGLACAWLSMQLFTACKAGRKNYLLDWHLVIVSKVGHSSTCVSTFLSTLLSNYRFESTDYVMEMAKYLIVVFSRTSNLPTDLSIS